MLEQMRKGAQHPVMKVMFFLLAGMFVLWGVGDVFRNGGGAAYVATIGKTGISPDELDNIVRDEVARYQQATGKNLTEEEINSLGIKKYALGQLIRNKITTIRAEDMHLVAGKKNIASKIYENNIFFDDNGKFDRNRFKKILNDNGFSEESFINSIRTEAAVDDLIESVSTVAAVPNDMVNHLYKYRNETRVADIIILPENYIKEIPEPAETDLVQFYQDNQNNFSAPEQRSVTYITFNADKIKSGIKISTGELQAEYQANLPLYTSEASRDVTQYLFSTQEDAVAAYEKISKGDTAEFESNKIELGAVTPASLPSEVKDAVFSLNVKEISQPVQSPLGWHIFVVNAVLPAKAKGFEEVKKELEQDLLERKISDEFAHFGNQIEDEFAAGKTMEEVAEKFDIELHKIPAIEAGNITDTKASGLPDPDTLLPVIFNLDIGTPSSLTLLSDNSSYAILRVDSVTPSRIRALDEVKGMAIKMWKNQDKANKLKDIASDIDSKLRAGENMIRLINKMKLKLTTAQKVKRSEIDNGEYPEMLGKELFNLKQIGAFTSSYPNEKGDFVIARLANVIDANPADNIPEAQNLRMQLEEDVRSDIFAQYLNYLQDQYPVSIKSAALGE